MLKNYVWPLLLLLPFSGISYAQLPDFTELVEKNGGAIVNISSTHKGDKKDAMGGQQLPDGLPPEMEEFFKHFNQGPNGDLVPRNSKALGSGFVLSTDGYVLTNHHVVDDAQEIIVKLADRREIVAKLIGSDPSTDIAVLKITADNLQAVSVGEPSKLKVGEWVLAIGSPFGFDQSVTAGIVSAKGRSLPGGNYVPFIQTDVAINPGNSGGPLFNMEGKVVGINSQIYSQSGGYMGLSFAIPIDVVMNVVDQIKSKGKVSRGWLGVQIQDVTRELAESFGMPKPQGALVAKVIPNSPAEKAGLQIGDIITEFNGHTIETSGELPPMVGMTPIDQAAEIKFIRQGDKKTVPIKIGLLPEEEQIVADTAGPKINNRLGLTVTNLTDDERDQLQVPKNGVIVQQVSKGAGLDAGIQRGDVILRIQNTVVTNVTEFDKIIKGLPAGKSVAMLIQRRGSPIFLAIKIDK